MSIADEVPFEIPESWVWARIGSIFNLQAGKNITSSSISDTEYPGSFPCFGGNGIRGYVDHFNREGSYPLIGRQGALCGNINFAHGKFYATEHAVVVESFGGTDSTWAGLFLEAINLNQYATATAQPGLAVSNINRLLIPIPPIPEQKRIVLRYSELIPCVLQYEQSEKRLVTLNTKFPEELKKSILQMAVQGKLVPQNPSDEPASILLDRIRGEKERLVAEGKIKRDKNESVIFRRDNSHYEKRGVTTICIDNEIPFDLPDLWTWCRLKSICHDMRYGTAKKSLKAGQVAVLRMGNIQQGEIDYSNLVYSNDDSDNTNLLLQDRDILFNRTNSRELVGKTGIYRGDTPAIFAGYLVLIRPIIINPEYLNYVMNSQYEWSYCQNVRTDGINQSNVSASKIAELLIPVPPLAEQKRIVNKLVNVLPLTRQNMQKFLL